MATKILSQDIDTTTTFSLNANQFGDGAVSAPSLSFAADTNTGLFRVGADDLAIAANGIIHLEINTSNVSLPQVPLDMVGNAIKRVGRGTVAAPGFYFNNDPTTGLYWITTNEFAVSNNGVKTVHFDATNHVLIADGTEPAPALAFYNDTDTGISRSAANTMRFNTNGNAKMVLTATSVTMNAATQISGGVLSLDDGTVSAPILTFSSDTNTGIYRIGNDDMGFTTNGTKQFEISSTNITSSLAHLFAAGTVSLPGIAFSAATNMGFAKTGSAQFSAIVTGTSIADIGITGGTNYFNVNGQVDLATHPITSVTNVNGTFIGLGKNRIINGDMWVDQRKEGGTYSVAAGTTVKTVDRYTGTSNGTAAFSVARASATPPTGYQFYTRITTTTANASPASGDFTNFLQPIEGINLKDILQATSYAPSSLSFWVRSSLTGTFGVGILNTANTPVHSYIGQYTINSANTWEYKTISIPLDNSGGSNTFSYSDYSTQIRFDLGSGTGRESTANAWQISASAGWRASGNVKVTGTNGATWDITGLQFEAGATATAFESAPYEFQLHHCQRYFEKSYKIGTAISTSESSNQYIISAAQFNTTSMESATIPFKTRKRLVPSVTLYQSDGSSNNWQWINTSGTTTVRTSTVPEIVEGGFCIRQTTAVEYFAAGHWSADAE